MLGYPRVQVQIDAINAFACAVDNASSCRVDVLDLDLRVQVMKSRQVQSDSAIKQIRFDADLRSFQRFRLKRWVANRLCVEAAALKTGVITGVHLNILREAMIQRHAIGELTESLFLTWSGDMKQN